MPMMSKPFNAGVARKRTLIPDGVYAAVIVATDVRVEGEAADEETLVVQMEVALGENEKRQVFESFRLNHPSTPVREIAEKALVQALEAMGIDELTDTDELHGKQMAVRVTTQTSANYPPRNRYLYLPAGAAA